MPAYGCNLAYNMIWFTTGKKLYNSERKDLEKGIDPKFRVLYIGIMSIVSREVRT